MSVVKIRAALETALSAITPALATAWENAVFTPAAGTAYQVVNLLMATPENPEMGRTTIERGFLQVSLMYPSNAGPAAAATRAELIRTAFYRGLTLSNGGVTTLITNTPEIVPGSIDGDRYAVPVRIRFRATY